MTHAHAEVFGTEYKMTEKLTCLYFFHLENGMESLDAMCF